MENKINYLGKKGIDIVSLKGIINCKKVILKTQRRFKNERHNVFIEEINRIDLSSNDDKRMQLVNSIETCAYGMSKDLIWKNEKLKRITIIKNYKNI